MRKSLPVILIVVAIFLWQQYQGGGFGSSGSGVATGIGLDGGADSVLAETFRDGRSDVQVEGEGVVTRVLADDNDGSRHQRFILELTSGQTLLVAHNIDLAPRIPGLAAGDRVRFYGEYEWNDQGGVMHWTHADPAGRHIGGWLEHQGRRYQ